MDEVEKPKEEDCCGSGCTPCIFDVYEQKLKLLNAARSKEELSAFSDIKYNSFLLVAVQDITEDIKKYTFQAVSCQNLSISFKSGDYIILKSIYKDENNCQEQISRPYTPILNSNMKGRFEVIVRVYKDGKMSSTFRDLIPGSVTYWRGPYNHLSLKKTNFLLLLGAGTGIVPLYNIVKELLEDELNESIVKLTGCFKNIESIILRDEIQSLSSYWNCSSEYFISENTCQSVRYNEKIHFEKFSGESFRNMLSKFDLGNLFIVICGPDAFNRTFKDVALSFGLCENDNVQIL